VRVPICLLLSACGRIGFDASGVDGGIGSLDGSDPAGDGAVTTNPACSAAWQAGPTFAAPVRIAELATAADDDDPWVSDDGLRIYFALTSGNNSDVVVASRGTPTESFGAPNAVAIINSNQNELRPWLSADERSIAFVSARGGSAGFDLWFATRATATNEFDPPLQTPFQNINTSGADMDPALSSDGLRLYYSMPPQTNQSLALATRTMPEAAFASAVIVSELNDPALPDLDPAPSRDELVMVFTSFRGGGGFHLYYATRGAVADPWSTPQPVPGVNDTGFGDDRSPYLSADQCTLYFASSRAGGAGGLDLYVASLQP
jgi:hypothetical protein